MHNYTENHPAPAVCLQTPLELPLGIASLSAWHRAKAGGAAERAADCRRRFEANFWRRVSLHVVVDSQLI